MKCRRCGSELHCKDGIVKNRQRFKCKDCNYRYTVEKKSNVKSEETKLLPNVAILWRATRLSLSI